MKPAVGENPSKRGIVWAAIVATLAALLLGIAHAEDPVKNLITEPIQFQIRPKNVIWDAPPDGPAPDSYRVYWGRAPGAYIGHVEATTNNLVATIPIDATGVWHIAATSVIGDLESVFSEELVLPISRPAPPGGVRPIQVQVTVTVQQ